MYSFFRKEMIYSPYFSTIVIAAIEKYGILKVSTMCMLS